MQNKNEGQEKQIDIKKIKRKKILTCIFCVLLALIIFWGGYFTKVATLTTGINKANEIVSIINSLGYNIDKETGEIVTLDEDKLADIIVSGFLDRYSAYYTKEEYETLKERQKGNYNGVGISFSTENDLIVKGIISNSPAQSVDISIGDKLTAGKIIGGEKENFSTLEEFKAFLEKIENDVPFYLYFIKENESEESEIQIEKKNYKATYVTYSDSETTINFNYTDSILNRIESVGNTQFDSDTAYIKLNEFEGTAGEEIKEALSIMQENNRTKLILDLRNNPGGHMDILLEVCSYLVYNDGKAGVMAKAIGKDKTEEFKTTGNNFNTNITSIVVLANENSASASECLIGAMLSLNGDIFNYSNLVIEKNSSGIAKTYGKGIMQTTYLLPAGGALKLTTAKVVWPDEQETCIHDKGIIASNENSVDKGKALDRAIEILAEK